MNKNLINRRKQKAHLFTQNTKRGKRDIHNSRHYQKNIKDNELTRNDQFMRSEKHEANNSSGFADFSQIDEQNKKDRVNNILDQDSEFSNTYEDGDMFEDPFDLDKKDINQIDPWDYYDQNDNSSKNNKKPQENRQLRKESLMHNEYDLYDVFEDEEDNDDDHFDNLEESNDKKEMARKYYEIDWDPIKPKEENINDEFPIQNKEVKLDGSSDEFDSSKEYSNVEIDKFGSSEKTSQSSFDTETTKYIEEIDMTINNITSYDYQLSPSGNVKRFKDLFKGLLLFTDKDKKWYRWNGILWENISEDEVRRYARYSNELIKENKIDKRETIEKAVKRFSSFNEVNATYKLAQGEKEILFKKEFNPHKTNNLLNVLEGTIDLKTGKLLSSDPDDRITKMINASYNKNATCPNWQKFLSDIFDNDMETIDYLQKAIGYSFTGETKEQVFFIIWGPGGTGKTTFTSILRELAGDYGKNARIDSFLSGKPQSTHRNDIASLVDSRFVVIPESNYGDTMDELFIKLITGEDGIVARHLYKEFKEYKPKSKLWFVTNHVLQFNISDKSILRRLIVIPFDHEISEDERDDQLKHKLRDEMPGIINWVIEGAQKWYASGLKKKPARIKNTINKYLEIADPMQRFIDEKCRLEPGAEILGKVLYEAYQDWVKKQKINLINIKTFYRLLANKGINKHPTKTNEGIKLLGIRLE